MWVERNYQVVGIKTVITNQTNMGTHTESYPSHFWQFEKREENEKNGWVGGLKNSKDRQIED